MRGRLPEIRDPAQGVALAKCYLARAFPITRGALRTAVNNSHPERCRFCTLTDEEILAVLDDFNMWSGIASGELRQEVEAFAMLPIEDQRILSGKAAMLPLFIDDL